MPPSQVGLADYQELAKGQMLGGADGFLKLIFHTETLKLLGVHCIGDGATEIIHIGQASLLRWDNLVIVVSAHGTWKWIWCMEIDIWCMEIEDELQVVMGCLCWTHICGVGLGYVHTTVTGHRIADGAHCAAVLHRAAFGASKLASLAAVEAQTKARRRFIFPFHNGKSDQQAETCEGG